jgi:hydrogenase maturation protease
MNQWEWDLLEDKTPVDHLEVAGVALRKGSRVRLCPRPGGDVMDLALSGQTATVECIEQDYEGKHQLSVVLDQDPGRDMGLLRQPGHRFFFTLEEVEPLGPEEASPATPTPAPRILVAGIGNIFLGDDAFGVEVIRRLVEVGLPPGVRVADFGIRGMDLAYALGDGYAVTILVDACPRGAAPGTVYVIEPDLKALDEAPPAVPDAHGMNPVEVLRMARAMGVAMQKVILVGCEPETLGGEEGQMNLSPAVEKAVQPAVEVIRSLVDRWLQPPETNLKQA